MKGSIPPNFGKVGNLRYLALSENSLGSYSFGDLEFLDSLTNCTQLETLMLGRNRFGGDLPTSVVNLSRNLVYLDLAKNHISGSIPHDIGNLISLQELRLGGNMLTGPFPTSLGKLSDLGSLSFYENRISGEIPSFISNFTLLTTLDLFNNSFDGIVPPSLGNCKLLQHLWLRYNKLNGTIPHEIMEISSLLTLYMQHNSLSGSLPKDVGQLQNLDPLYLGNNKLLGNIPKTLGNCLSMKYLNLGGNSFDGDIPDIRGFVDVKILNLLNNNLSGSIPGYFANFSSLEILDLSINKFERMVPTEGKFQNSTTVSVFGNKDLCGGIKELKLKPCIVQAPPMETKHFSKLKKVVIGVSVALALLLLLFIALFSLCWFRKRHKNQQEDNPVPSTLEISHEKISYGDLRNATNGFSSNNMVGSGSFGTVFKALLPTENKIVAVKVLNLQRHGAMKSFLAECEALKDIRHRNLLKLLTACASIDFQGNEFRALIYTFMPNGSLDMWLHPEEVEEVRRPSRALTLLERLNIAVDVASVLDYLHVHCHEPIAHCDLM